MKKILLYLFITISFTAISQESEIHISRRAPVTFTSSNLPIVLINTNGVTIPDEPKIDATMQVIFNGVGVMNNVTDTPNDFNNKIGIELRGSSSINYPQKPYKIETRNSLNVKQNVSLLGMPSESDWILLSNYNDKVFMRNTLSYKLFNEMGNYSTRSKFCEVVLNGDYVGVYLLMENIKRGTNRVNIAKLDPIENTGIDVTGGYIIKNDYWNATDSWLSNYHPIDHPTFDVHLVYEYPKPLNISTEQKTYIQGFVDQFEAALYSTNYADVTNGYNKYIDVNSFIDYLIVNELSRNGDGFKKSSYFNKDIDTPTSLSKLKAGPVWDFDWAWKNINECSIFLQTDGAGWAHKVNDCNPDVNSPGWYVRLLQDPNFQDKFRCRWNALRTTILSNSAITTYIDDTSSYLNVAQGRHYTKWEHLGVATGTPEVDANPTTFTGQIQKFKNWINLRLTWLDANIPGNANNCSLSIVENDKPSNNITLYPNPTKDYLNIKNEGNQNINSIEILDFTGKSVKKITGSFTENISIDVQEIENGIYFCKIVGDNNSKTFKFIVSNK
jgi:CotH kinase protein/Secretion system C-terminal sorting domain